MIKNLRLFYNCFILLIVATSSVFNATAQNGVVRDTINVISYNVLDFGGPCQCQGDGFSASPACLYPYLKSIVAFSNPDILGMVKMQSIKLSASDQNDLSPPGFADTVINHCFNAVYPGRYGHSTFSDKALSGSTTILFFDSTKFKFESMFTLGIDVEDFNLFKLAYKKDPNLSTTHDTTYLYIVLNHTQSGNAPCPVRDGQDSMVLNALKKHFYHLPNIIDMGDFNLHYSSEAGYQYLVNNGDSSFIFSDPPFYPDKLLKYQIDWDQNPSVSANYLSTSTRVSGSLPNSCGTSGGAKDWFDHILLSPWIINDSNYISYIPNSFNTIGNNGKRIGISVNDTVTNGKNLAAPYPVLNALYQFSNKYPVMCKLGLAYNNNGNGLPDPTIPTMTGLNNIQNIQSTIKISTLVTNQLWVDFPDQLIGKTIHVSCTDLLGRTISQVMTQVTGNRFVQSINSMPSGIYVLQIEEGMNRFCYRFIKE